MLDQLQSAYTSLGRIVGLVRIGSDHSGARSAVPTTSDAAAARTGSAGSAAAGSRAAAPVVVRDLDVHYGERRAVADVSFDVAPGASVALVGASGAGKSTVAAVVAGVRTPSRGAVRIAGQDPHALPPAERALVVALVSQESHVFSGTLRENLTLAAPNSGDRAVWDALRAVGLAEWVEELHEGLDTPRVRRQPRPRGHAVSATRPRARRAAGPERRRPGRTGLACRTRRGGDPGAGGGRGQSRAHGDHGDPPPRSGGAVRPDPRDG
nr:ATP-binding cassette domain-containing protein [Kocuria sp. cx-455]